MKETELIINVNPNSMFSESIKSIRTNLQFSAIDKEIKTVLITSPEPGNGKSFISANLAGAYAQDGKKVLIIDCDLRRGRQHNIFGIENSSNGGYSNLILNYKEEIKLTRYVTKTDIKGIDVIPTGQTPPNPLELLTSKNNEKVIKELRKHYDVIILDCPPVLGISDTQIMTKHSDANILVVTSGKTTIELVERCKKVFEASNSKIDGVIINNASVKGSSYNSYYASSYYSSDSE
ncbi:MAG: CpsD/CapB family tyrosine-protein kinase [Candidatus Coprovivens sp.]